MSANRTPSVLPEHIPQFLKEVFPWFTWALASTELGGVTYTSESPYSPLTGKPMPIDNPADFADFNATLSALQQGDQYQGLGIRVSFDLVIVEFEDCLDSVGSLKLWAAEFTDRCRTYCEWAPGKKSLKYFLRGQTPRGFAGRRAYHDGYITLYVDGSLCSVTGWAAFPQFASVESCQPALDWLDGQIREHGREIPTLDLTAHPADEETSIEVESPTAVVSGQQDFPMIQANDRQLRELTADSLAALQQRNDPPRLFVRGGKIVTIGYSPAEKKGKPSIEVLNLWQIRSYLSRSANYFRVSYSKEGPQQVSVLPPLDVAHDLLALSPADHRFPPLEGIIEAPVLRPDGSVILTAGYDSSTSLFFIPAPAIAGITVPSSPSARDVEWARNTVLEPFVDFPFVSEADRANALGLLIAPSVRLLTGIAPITIINAPQARTGKTLLAKVVLLTHTGGARIMTAPPNSEEWGKVLAAALSAGRDIVVFDNVPQRLLDSDVLAALTTSDTYEIRPFGSNTELMTLPQRTTFVLVGNNVMISREIALRSFWIEINAATSAPHKRTGFRHAKLLTWVKENRPSLLRAILILARSWFAAGMPMSDVPVIGGFESHYSVIGGILAHARIPNYMGNFDELSERADLSVVQYEVFLNAVLEAFPEPERMRSDRLQSRAFTSRELLERIQQNRTLSDTLPDDLVDSVKRESPQRLAIEVNKIKDRRHGERGIYITVEGQRREKVNLWRVCVTNRISE